MAVFCLFPGKKIVSLGPSKKTNVCLFGLRKSSTTLVLIDVGENALKRVHVEIKDFFGCVNRTITILVLLVFGEICRSSGNLPKN